MSNATSSEGEKGTGYQVVEGTHSGWDRVTRINLGNQTRSMLRMTFENDARVRCGLLRLQSLGSVLTTSGSPRVTKSFELGFQSHKRARLLNAKHVPDDILHLTQG